MESTRSLDRGAYHLVPLAAADPGQLAGLAHAALAWLERHDAPGAWTQLAFTLAVRAQVQPWPCRASAVIASGDELRTGLRALVSDGLPAWTGPDGAARFTGTLEPSPPPSLAWIIAGTGAQWPGMGLALHAHDEAFRGALDACADAIAHHTSWSLLDELRADPERSRLRELEIGAMATFAIEVALGHMLRTWGIAPGAIAGHSMGEIVAAHLAGALSLEDATRVIFAWSDVQRRIATPGEMLVVGLPAAALDDWIAGERAVVSVAATNSPRSTTLSGAAAALRALEARLVARGVMCRALSTGGAFHGHEMDPLEEPLIQRLAGLAPRPPATPLYTTVQGAGGAARWDAVHWWRNLRSTVDLHGTMGRLTDAGVRVFWELGAHPVLASAMAECLEARSQDAVILGTLRRRGDDVASVLAAAGALYGHGGALEWSALYRGRPHEHAELGPIASRALPVRSPHAVPPSLEPDAPAALLPTVIAMAAQLVGRAPGDFATSGSWLDAGLESLHVVKLRAMLHKQLQLEIPLARLFSAGSIEDFVQGLEAELAGRAAHAPTGGHAAVDRDLGHTPSAPAALSHGQRGLWFLQQLHPASCAYNLAWPARIESALDADALRRAFVALVARHPALRTVFVQDGPHVRPELPADWGALLQLRHHDASGWSDEAVQAAVNAAYRVPFQLSRGPTLRVDLFTTAADRHVLLVVVHHIAADAWSLDVMLRDLGALYAAHATGTAAELPALPWTMQDHVARQHEMLDGPTGEALWQRWRDRLAGELPTLELSAGAARPVSPASDDGRSAVFSLDPELSAAVRRLAKQEGCTVFVVLLSAFYALLARTTRTRELVIGTPMAGRDRDELANLVGYFVNLVPLRARIAPDLPFTALLAQVRDVVLQAMADQAMPFDLLVERLAPERDATRGPLVQALFEYRQPQHEGELLWLTVAEDSPRRVNLGGLSRVGRFPLTQQEGKFELQLEMADLTAAIAGIWKYRPSVIDDARIAGMTRQLSALLRGAVASPATPVDALPILDRDERAALAARGRARTAFAAVRPVHTWFEAVAAAQPDAVAVVDGLDQLTYGELNRRANRVAHALRARGVVPGQLIGLCVQRSARIVLGALAILKAGAAYVPLDPELPPDRLAHYADDAALAIVLGHAATRALVDAPLGVLDLDELAADAAGRQTDLDLAIGDDDPAYVIYTSGSTGRPKGVVVSHRNVSRLFVATERDIAPGPSDAWTLFHSYAFDFSVWEIWGALLYGGRLVIVSREASRSPELLHGLLCSEGVTVLCQTPSAFQALSQIDELRGASARLSLRLVIFGGEALAPGTLARWVARHGDRQPRLVNMYGITETCVHVTYRELSRADIERATASAIGRPIDDLSLYVLDDRMELVPPGVPGEIYVGGDGVALGYLARAGLTAERFVPDPFATEPGRRLYRTGDLARLAPDTGDLEYLGRIDSQVKIRGFRIELGEIEHVLRAQPAVRDAVVVVADGQGGDRFLIAYVVPRREIATEPDDVLAATLRDAAAATLPTYMVPTAVVMIDRVPLNHNGKLDRTQLPAWSRQARADAAFEPPRTELERRLAAIWTELLPVERVGRTDQFFHVGGHSLIATRLILRIREQLGVELPILSVFEHPMLCELAAEVERARPRAADDPIARVDRAVDHPLGLAQQRLWFLDQLDAGNPVYNVPMLFRITGRLDRAALEHSLEAIAARHEVLRTSFPVVAGQPVQRIAPAGRCALATIDLRDLPASAAAERARVIASDEFHRPFDLAAGPLWRAQLVMLSDDHHWLVMCAHHAVLDGWSVNLYLGELTALYRAFIGGTPAERSPAPLQYLDFSAWQRRWLAGDTLTRQLAYWKTQLAGAPTVLELPGDRPRPPVQRFRGGLVPYALTPAQAAAVHRIALDEQATPFIVLLAVFQTLLHRMTGQRDLLVGSPVASRPRPELEHLLGCFVNNLVLRARFDGRPSFRRVLRGARQGTLAAFEHQDVPFELLVDLVSAERDLSRNPVFQVMFALENTPRPAGELPGLRIEPVLPDSEISKFDLSLNLTADGAGFTGFFEYASDLYDRETIESLAASFSTLLDHALADPERPVDELAILPEAARRRVLHDWNPPDEPEPAPCTIGERFAAQATARPGERCLVTRHETLSYGEVSARARRIAHQLVREGVGPDVRVGLCMSRTAELPIAMLAVQLAGGAIVPMDPKYPPDRLAYMASDSGAALIIADAAGQAALGGFAGRVLRADELARRDAGDSPAADLPRGAVDDLAYVIYTSGSTGLPKGTALPHRGVSALVRWSHRVYAADDLAGVLASTSICFDLSIFELFVTWSRGGTVVLVEDLLDLANNPVAGEVRLINTVPSAMTELLRMNAVPASARVINLAGEPIRQALVDDLYALGSVHSVYNLYGPTEDTVYSTFARLAPSVDGPPPIGVAIDHGRAYVLDDHLAPVPVGVHGELYLGGAGLAHGYIHQPALTAERFVPDPFGPPGSRLYRTGDLARWRRDGQLEFLGRNDGQVKLRGFRIELGEIEEALARHARVREVAVVVRDDGGRGPRLVAYVATPDGTPCEPGVLRDHLHTMLPSYMVPASFVIQAALPHTPNGKIDRRALRAQPPEPPQTAAAGPAPTTTTEAQVASIWRDVLGLPEVAIDDSFFDLGGHSLLLTRVHVQLADRFPGRLTLTELFQYPTVRSVAAFLDAGAHGAVAVADHGRTRAAIRRGQRDARRHERRKHEP